MLQPIDSLTSNLASFQIASVFIDQFVGREPQWGPLGKITYKRTYARPVDGENRTEEWWETIQRVVNGTFTIQRDHCKRMRIPWFEEKAQRSAEEMYQRMWDFKFLPPGRGLWMMGTPFIDERGSAALNNCAFVSTSTINQLFSEPFTFLMDMSMHGVGVGFDTLGAGTVTIQKPVQNGHLHIVEDSREGWSQLIAKILDSYVGKHELPIDIDYSRIRKKGERLKSFGGTAGGPDPLIRLVDDIHDILTPLIGASITSPAIVDLQNAIGRCVVAGNTRRSAEIALGGHDDLDFIQLKDWSNEANRDAMKKWRWASNNSVVATVGMNYDQTARQTMKNGEPGYFWLGNARDFGRMKDGPNYRDARVAGCNPCAEQSLEDKELCCLVETFPARHDTFEDFQLTLKMAYLYAKTVTLLPTHNEVTNAVMLRNRRIGTSMSGITQSISKHGWHEHFLWCDNGYAYLQELDTIYSEWLAVPRSVKQTSVKPSGTVSLLPGATPGIHYPISEYYYRTIRFDNESPILAAARDAGYRVEPDQSDETNRSVAYFPVKEENYTRSEAEVSMWEQLELAAQMQSEWADNQVSVTVKFGGAEAEHIPRALAMYDKRLKAVAFLPYSTVYPQAPYIPITQEEYIQAKASTQEISFETAYTEGDAPAFCDSDHCEVVIQ